MAIETFQHTAGKKKITLPKFDQVFTNFGQIRAFKKLAVEDQLFALIEQAADDANLEKIDSLTMVEVKDLVAAWQLDAGITVGES